MGVGEMSVWSGAAKKGNYSDVARGSRSELANAIQRFTNIYGHHSAVVRLYECS